jgi:hypothetical protein
MSFPERYILLKTAHWVLSEFSFSVSVSSLEVVSTQKPLGSDRTLDLNELSFFIECTFFEDLSLSLSLSLHRDIPMFEVHFGCVWTVLFIQFSLYRVFPTDFHTFLSIAPSRKFFLCCVWTISLLLFMLREFLKSKTSLFLWVQFEKNTSYYCTSLSWVCLLWKRAAFTILILLSPLALLEKSNNYNFHSCRMVSVPKTCH